MKVTKIDLTKTLLDVRDGTPVWWEAQYDPRNAMAYIGRVPEQVSVTEHAYEIREIATRGLNGAKEKRHYAVKMDERGLFDDLMQISNDVFSEKLEKAKEEGFWEGESKGAKRGRKTENERIKSLSWWKRLRNNV